MHERGGVPQLDINQFCKLIAKVPAHYDTDFVYMRLYHGRYLDLNEE